MYMYTYNIYIYILCRYARIMHQSSMNLLSNPYISLHRLPSISPPPSSRSAPSPATVERPSSAWNSLAPGDVHPLDVSWEGGLPGDWFYIWLPNLGDSNWGFYAIYIYIYIWLDWLPNLGDSTLMILLRGGFYENYKLSTYDFWRN